jgi:hypothetical protein
MGQPTWNLDPSPLHHVSASIYTSVFTYTYTSVFNMVINGLGYIQLREHLPPWERELEGGYNLILPSSSSPSTSQSTRSYCVNVNCSSAVTKWPVYNYDSLAAAGVLVWSTTNHLGPGLLELVPYDQLYIFPRWLLTWGLWSGRTGR